MMRGRSRKEDEAEEAQAAFRAHQSTVAWLSQSLGGSKNVMTGRSRSTDVLLPSTATAASIHFMRGGGGGETRKGKNKHGIEKGAAVEAMPPWPHARSSQTATEPPPPQSGLPRREDEAQDKDEGG